MPTKRELEARISTLKEAITSGERAGRILVQEKRRLREQVAAAQERIEELEARLKSTAPPRPGVIWNQLYEARASVALDKNLDGSDVTQCDEEEAPDDNS